MPLAGFLLDYPVCYSPVSDDQSEFLSAVPLDVYECSLVRAEGTHSNIPTSHLVMKFTCPGNLGKQHAHLSPRSLMETLNNVISHRLLQLSPTCSLEITHKVISLDRVAL